MGLFRSKNNKGKDKNKKANSISKKQLEQYRDPTTGLTLKKLKMGLWVEEHIPFFKKIIIGLLIFSCIGLWIYSIIGFGWYIFKGMERDEQMINELTRERLISHKELIQKNSNNLNTGSVKIMGYASNYDLSVKVKSTSKQYRAKFDYCFLQGNKEIDCGHSFIFPKKTKYILSLANELDSADNIHFQITGLKWNKINYREIRNWKKFLDKHLNFVFKDVQFNSNHQNELSDKENLNNLSFNVVNDTPYSYWEAPFNIFFYNTSNLIAVNRYVVNKFYSGKERNVELVWHGYVNRVTNIEIKPELNIMDKDIYIKPQAAKEVDMFLPEQ